MIHRQTAAFITLVFLLVGSPGAAEPSPQAAAMTYLEGLWRSTGTPGISAAVAVKGKLVFSGSVGFADLDNMVPTSGSTVYNIGSVSKVITAIAVMQLVERHSVSLDDPIQKYVPSFPQKPEGPITIRNILTHTSGSGITFRQTFRDRKTTRTSGRSRIGRRDWMSSRTIRFSSRRGGITPIHPMR